MDIERVSREIVELHVEFERWFDGTSPSLDRVDASLASDFLFVGTGGAVIARADVLGFLESAKNRQHVKIGIDDVELAWGRDDLTCATYVEVQTAGDGTTTRRRSSCVLQADPTAPNGLVWLSVHETWIEPPPSAT